ncbi:interleukin-12 receptor subunit beta-2 [Centroberyx gerrardi]
MATIPKPWSILTVITVLAVQFCIGQKSCVIWSSAGTVVQRGSNFTVYCTFNCKCKGSMYADNVREPKKHENFNSTTLCLKVVNITECRTYSCQCNHCRSALDPCGLDISAGYPPDVPKNINCIQNVISDKKKVVVCTWNSGRETYLRNTSKLWARTTSGNRTDQTDFYTGSRKGSDLLSVNFQVSSSVQLISVWVKANNPLGAAESSTFNYTLSDIVMPSPPVLVQADCSSRGCEIKVEQSLRTEHLEIQYRTEQQAWTTHPHTGVQTGSVRVQSISSLEPYRLYYFRARAKFSTGLWSQWSTNISNWTQEEAPDKELDVWFAELSSEFNSMTVYWKRLNDSNARGKIIEYRVKVHNFQTGSISISNISANASRSSVPSCANCAVSLFARNSKGLSPPATVPSLHKTAPPPQDVRVKAGNRSVTICWRKPETTLLPTGYLVEWHPEGQKLDELQWVRLGRDEDHAVITGIEPFECYEGAVFVLYESSVGRARFRSVSTVESAPTGGPSVKEQVEGDKVTVSWTELPREQRRGCVRKYTIYIKNIANPELLRFYTPASDRMCIIKDLPPASYSLWMTASTAKEEGPAGEMVKFFIQQESQVFLLLVLTVVGVVVVVLLCLCQCSAVQQRFCMLFHCLMLNDVPDPANSKWARECAKEKGRMDLQLQLSDSVTEEENEPIIVDVEELHEESRNNSTPAADASPLLCPQTGLSRATQPAPPLYPQTSYIKSFSHDSDSSDHTHTSLDTNTTVDYISSHGPLDGIEDEDEEEEEDEREECMEVLGFFPSHNAFMDPLVFGGKLTLDAVKIDCGSFFENG